MTDVGVDDPLWRWRAACEVFDVVVPWFIERARAAAALPDAQFGTLWSRVPAARSVTAVSPPTLLYLSIRIDGVYEPYETRLGYKSAPDAFELFDVPTVDQARALMSGRR